MVARHDDAQYLLVFVLFFIFHLLGEEAGYHAEPSLRTEGKEEAPDLVLKEDDECYGSNRAHGVEEIAHHLHVEHSPYKCPYSHKHKDAVEDVQGSRSLHQPPDVVEEECHEEDVKRILKFKVK